MIVLDANVLIYAYAPVLPQHERAKRWLESAFAGGEQVCIPWTTITAFLRIMTNHRVFNPPTPIRDAVDRVAEWLSLPHVAVVNPGDRHFEILGRLVVEAQATANLVTDAHLAALAIEHGATLATSDRDFARFVGVKTVDPIDVSKD